MIVFHDNLFQKLPQSYKTTLTKPVNPRLIFIVDTGFSGLRAEFELIITAEKKTFNFQSKIFKYEVFLEK